MTVSSSTNKVSFNGDGSTTVFAYSFKVFDESDLTVILRASDGTETTQTITTNYTVSGVGDAGGGNVTMVTAPASGEQLTILREQPLTQGLDLVPNDPFPANSIEDSLDKLTFMVQQQQEELDRSIKASKTTTISTVEFVESAATRANKVFAFDGSGDLDLTQEIGTFQGDWAASTAYAVRDIVKDTNNNNIYIANTAHTSSGTVPLTGNADIAKWDLLVDAAAATTSANNAATSATAAATSATAAATSATAAATSESNAATSASNASTSETNAAASATNAATSESNAAGSESAAATSESNAATSATNASTSASAAATSATNAATSESNAAASQSAAATSETNAATSATSAATNATNAATSASNASTAQTAAETAQTAAEAAQAAAELAADNFDDTYLGSKSSDPTVDNDGGALNAGDLYFNTTSNTLKVYSGSAWQDAAVDSSGFVQTTGDTMTGDLDIQGTLTSDGLTVDGASSIRHSDATTNISLTPTSTGGVVNVRDSSGNSQIVLDARTAQVGIGTTSPSAALDVSTGGSTKAAIFDGNGVEITHPTLPSNLFLGTQTGSDVKIASVGAYPMLFHTNGSERMRIDSSGNVGIGTSSPASVGVAGMPALSLMSTTSGRSGGLYWQDTGGTTVANSYFFGSVFNLGTETSHPFAFRTGGTERMRIDSIGTLLVGKTSADYGATAGFEFRGDNDTLYLANDSDKAIALNRNTSDGEIISFRKNDSPVGSIGTLFGDLYAATGNTGIRFVDANRSVSPYDSNASALVDAAVDLGYASARYKDLYLSGGVYLGGVGSSNKLDDYETGSWTPVLKDGSVGAVINLSASYGYYTKIGRQVTIYGYSNRSDSTAYGSTLLITGLPFTSTNLVGYTAFNGGAWSDQAYTTDPIGIIYSDRNTTTAYVKTLNQSQAYFSSSDIENGRPIYFSFHYVTDS